MLEYILLLTLCFSTSQLEQFKQYILRCAEIGIDALIVQDLGAVQIIKQVSPDFPIHTQMTIHSVNGIICKKTTGFSEL